LNTGLRSNVLDDETLTALARELLDPATPEFSIALKQEEMLLVVQRAEEIEMGRGE
jgi:hypothetical protein